MQPFYNSPAFWAFLTTVVGVIRWLLRVSFHYRRKANVERAKLSMSVERFKADNIQKSIDYLNGVVSRIEPLVVKHEAMASQLDESTKMVSMIEKNLTSMFRSLQTQYESFEGRITKITASYQMLVDRVDKLSGDDLKVGKVIYKK